MQPAGLAGGEHAVMWVVCRIEDWPVMPVEHCGELRAMPAITCHICISRATTLYLLCAGFKLKPVGFFSCNPGIDIPPGPLHPALAASLHMQTCAD